MTANLLFGYPDYVDFRFYHSLLNKHFSSEIPLETLMTQLIISKILNDFRGQLTGICSRPILELPALSSVYRDMFSNFQVMGSTSRSLRSRVSLPVPIVGTHKGNSILVKLNHLSWTS